MKLIKSCKCHSCFSQIDAFAARFCLYCDSFLLRSLMIVLLICIPRSSPFRLFPLYAFSLWSQSTHTKKKPNSQQQQPVLYTLLISIDKMLKASSVSVSRPTWKKYIYSTPPKAVSIFILYLFDFFFNSPLLSSCQSCFIRPSAIQWLSSRTASLYNRIKYY